MSFSRRIQYVLGKVKPQAHHRAAWLMGVGAVALALGLTGAGVGGDLPWQSAIAQDREDGRSVERGGKRRSPEREGERPSAEAEGGRRRSAEGDNVPGLERFRPETPREEALVRVIRELQKEVARLRREVRNRGEERRDGERRDGERRDEREGGRGDSREGDQRARSHVSGTFKGYDTAMNSLTVSLRRGEGEGAARERVLTLGKNAEIIADNKKGTVAHLGDECLLQIWLQEGTRDQIRRIEATGQRIGGRRGVGLRRVDAEKRTVTLRAEDPSRAKTYRVSDDARVFMDGKPARLAQLSLERRVSLQLASDMKTVIAIQQGDPERERRQLSRERRIFRSVDKDRNSLVTFEEYFVLSEGQDAGSRARWQTMFKRSDRNGDGAWSLSEFVTARTGRRYEGLENGDGRVRRDGQREGREREGAREGDRDRE